MFIPTHKGIICDESIVEEVKSIDRIILDDKPADNGNKKTQDEWFNYWGKINDGRVMASMGDFYVAFKDLKNRLEQGSDAEKAKARKLFNGFHDDFDWTNKNNWLIGSTRLVYEGNNINGKIIQYYSCKSQELVKESSIEIPVYSGTPVIQVANNTKGLAYLQTYFDTTDDAETIIQTLEFISGKNRDKIMICTANSSDRRSILSMAAGLIFSGGQFHVYGSFNLFYIGRSRGVKLK